MVVRLPAARDIALRARAAGSRAIHHRNGLEGYAPPTNHTDVFLEVAMAVILQTRHVLPLLKEQGVRVSRGSLAAMSDLLGLQTRPKAGNEEKRQWLRAEVDLLVAALVLRRRWRLSEHDLRVLLDDADGSHAQGLVDDLRGLLDRFRTSSAAVQEEARWWDRQAAAAGGSPAAQRTTAA